MNRTAFPQFLRRPQASQYLAEIWGLQYAASTLGKMCSLGSGPETHHCGRIALHTPESLDEFAKSRIRGPSRKTHPATPSEVHAR
jgi:hypothetical protein